MDWSDNAERYLAEHYGETIYDRNPNNDLIGAEEAAADRAANAGSVAPWQVPAAWNGWNVAVIEGRVWLVNPINGHRVSLQRVTTAPAPMVGPWREDAF